jgi:hypothetical protein
MLEKLMNEWQQSGSPQVLGRLNNARARKAIHHEGKSFSLIVTITMIAFFAHAQIC